MNNRLYYVKQLAKTPSQKVTCPPWLMVIFNKPLLYPRCPRGWPLDGGSTVFRWPGMWVAFCNFLLFNVTGHLHLPYAKCFNPWHRSQSVVWTSMNTHASVITRLHGLNFKHCLVPFLRLKGREMSLSFNSISSWNTSPSGL